MAASSSAASSRTAVANAVRPVLRGVLRRLGTLYQPLYLGPVADADLVSQEVQALADQEGVPVAFDRDGVGDVAANMTGAGAILLSAAAAERHLAAGTLGALERHQVIIWGPEAIEAMSPGLQAWVARGLSLDPAPYLRASGAEWQMGRTIERAARDPGVIVNPIILVAPATATATVANEAMLRLEAAGLGPTVTLAHTARSVDAAVQRLGHGSAAVIEVPRHTAAQTSLRDLATTLLARRVQLVLLAATDVLESLRADESGWADLLSRSIAIVVQADTGPRGAVEAARAQRVESYPDWPAASDLVVGAPSIGRPGTLLFAGQAGAEGQSGEVAISSTIQLIALQRLSGRLVVFAAHRVGAIDFETGRIVHARYVGDRWTASSLLAARLGTGQRPEPTAADVAEALVYDRAVTIGMWSGTRFAFLSSPSDAAANERVSLRCDDLPLEISRRVDDLAHRQGRIGSIGRVWAQATAPTTADVTPVGHALWHALDGQRRLSDAAGMLGLLDEEAFEAINALHAGGFVAPVGAVDTDAVGLPVHQVAATLLGWGLVSEARAVLDDAAAEDELTPEGKRLLGHLYVSVDSAAAAATFREGLADLPATADGLDYHCNIDLLEARGRQGSPHAVWEHLISVLRPRGAHPLPTARHYAIVTELAIRAGDRATAQHMLAGVEAFGTPEATALAAALAPALALLDS